MSLKFQGIGPPLLLDPLGAVIFFFGADFFAAALCAGFLVAAFLAVFFAALRFAAFIPLSMLGLCRSRTFSAFRRGRRGSAGPTRRQARSTANRLRSVSEQYTSAPSCVARNTPRGGSPASSASCQRGAHRHQRSPGLRPGKPNSGIGVERSFPRDLENARKSAVMTAQTVWLPKSSSPVLQQPSRKNPVI